LFVSEKKVKKQEERKKDIFLREREKEKIDVVVLVHQTRTKKSFGTVVLFVAKRLFVFFFFVRVVFNERERATTTFQGRAKTGTTTR
jgi:hypothetical protein